MSTIARMASRNDVTLVGMYALINNSNVANKIVSYKCLISLITSNEDSVANTWFGSLNCITIYWGSHTSIPDGL